MNQKGFIQIPLLIVIVVSILMASAGTSFVLYQQSKKAVTKESTSVIQAEIQQQPREQTKSDTMTMDIPQETQTNESGDSSKETQPLPILHDPIYDENPSFTEGEQSSVWKLDRAAEQIDQEATEATNKMKLLGCPLLESHYCGNRCWKLCSEGYQFVCSATGQGVCKNLALSSQEYSIKPSGDSDTKSCPTGTILCNNKCWQACPVGNKFNCPPSGGAYCTAPESPLQESKKRIVFDKLTDYFLEQYQNMQNELKPLEDQWNAVYAEMKAQCPSDQLLIGIKATKCREYSNQLLSITDKQRLIMSRYGYGDYSSYSEIQPYRPKYEEWRLSSDPNGMSGTIWSPTHQKQYRWTCMTDYDCVVYDY